MKQIRLRDPGVSVCEASIVAAMFTVIAACFTCRVVVRVEVVVRVLVDVEVVVVRRNLPDKHLYKRHALSNCTQQN